MSRTIGQDAASIVFANVLLQQLGLPIPAVPTMLVAGSLLAGPRQAMAVLAAALLASVAADLVWYAAGRLFGYRVLAGLCRLSINPASCVSQTESRFTRWGPWSLVIAKFVPGFSTVAPPIAGALRMRLPAFIGAAGAGALLWSAAAIGAGWLLRERVHLVLSQLAGRGSAVVVAILGVFGLWLAWKYWQKFRFERLAAIPHITPVELAEAMASPTPPLLLDLRGSALAATTGPLPGAVRAELGELRHAVGDWPKSAPIVTLCACPHDATAVQGARELLSYGFTSVRPLRGGFNALPSSLRPAATPLDAEA